MNVLKNKLDYSAPAIVSFEYDATDSICELSSGFIEDSGVDDMIKLEWKEY